MATFIYLVVNFALDAIVFLLIANAILSWLVAFNVVNLRNRTAYAIGHFLDRITRPILAPFQRFIPTLGGIDISPIAALIIIIAAQQALVPMILLLRPFIG